MWTKTAERESERYRSGVGAFNEYGRLMRVLLRPVRDAFTSPSRIDHQWRALNFSSPPDLERALAQQAAFAAMLAGAGARIEELSGPGLTLDSIYVRDASILTARGMLLCRMGKSARRDEPAEQRRLFEAIGVPVAGTIEGPGQIEGGDVVWFDERTVAVGRGYRTNDEGIAQFRALVGDAVDVIVVPLPHHRGPADVFHLMSIISPVDGDLAVVYSPLMPVPFREWLAARGIGFVEVPQEEFESMGANVLAVAPRRVVMLDGNPVTRQRLESAGVDVSTYDGAEISVKGGGGPTCLTRPLARE
jgi:N-dimethylarginine dimethylaminohydrolase